MCVEFTPRLEQASGPPRRVNSWPNYRTLPTVADRARRAVRRAGRAIESLELLGTSRSLTGGDFSLHEVFPQSTAAIGRVDGAHQHPSQSGRGADRDDGFDSASPQAGLLSTTDCRKAARSSSLRATPSTLSGCASSSMWRSCRGRTRAEGAPPHAAATDRRRLARVCRRRAAGRRPQSGRHPAWGCASPPALEAPRTGTLPA